MALGDNYATTTELKSRLNIPVDNTDYEPELDDALNSASREIERFTNRQFNRVETATPREFEPWVAVDYIWITDFWTRDDLVIKTDENGTGVFSTVWAATDYELYPRNNQEFGVDGFPYYKILPARNHLFPRPIRGEPRGTLQVTAKWGWEAVPAQVKLAALSLAARNFQMKDAPLGIAGSNEFGQVRVHDDKFVAAKLQGLRRCGGLRVG